MTIENLHKVMLISHKYGLRDGNVTVGIKWKETYGVSNFSTPMCITVTCGGQQKAMTHNVDVCSVTKLRSSSTTSGFRWYLKLLSFYETVVEAVTGWRTYRLHQS